MTASGAADRSLAEGVGAAPRRWRDRVEHAHRLAASAGLGGAAIVALVWPGAGPAAAPWGGAALLFGGALIGVPHGSSDFVVAHGFLRPAWGRGWLPMFLVGYLAIVALVLSAWSVAPLATLLAFIVLSGLHFGLGDLGVDEPRHGLDLAIRATTPLLPVLLHPRAGRVDRPFRQRAAEAGARHRRIERQRTRR